MIKLVFDAVNVGIGEQRGPDGQPTGNMIFTLQDPVSGIIVELPLEQANARSIGNALLGKPSVQIAAPGQMPNGPPQMPPR